MIVTFKTVFDAANQAYDDIWWFPLAGLPFVAAGALMVFKPDLMQHLMPGGLQGTARRIFSYFFLLFALCWTGVSFLSTYRQYTAAVSDLRSGHYSVAEGTVADFVPMPYGGHAMESFTVDGQRFSYSDYVITPGFHNTASHGGPIRAGLQARVTYSGNLILRLEIAD